MTEFRVTEPKISSISNELWNKVLQLRGTIDTDQKQKFVILNCVKYGVCAQISDEFKEVSGSDRYIIMALIPEDQQITHMSCEEHEDYLGNSRVDMYIPSTGVMFTVHILSTKERLQAFKMSRERSLPGLYLTWNGLLDNDEIQETFSETQLAQVRSYVCQAGLELRQKGYDLDEIDDSAVYDIAPRITFSKHMVDFLQKGTNLTNFHEPMMTDLSHLDLGIGLGKAAKYEKITKLPPFTRDPTSPDECCWNTFMIAGDSLYLSTVEGKDLEIVNSIFEKFELDIMFRKEEGFCNDTQESLMTSLKDLISGSHQRNPIKADLKGLGIGMKGLKKTELIQETNEDWKRLWHERDVLHPPTWVRDELESLEKDIPIKGLDLEKNNEITILDSYWGDWTDHFLDMIQNTKMAACIEKMLTTFSKIHAHMTYERDQVITYPITTRKSGKGQLWGFVVIGQRHQVMDTDQLNCIVLQFCHQRCLTPENVIGKYRKHSIGKLNTRKGEVYFLVKKHGVSKHRIFFHTQIRKCLLQPANMYSNYVSRIMATHKLDDFRLIDNFSIHLEKRGPVQVQKWVRELSCIIFLMTVFDNSQLEGFLANIRRFHLWRSAFMSGRTILIAEGIDPEIKVTECLIDNPMCFFLAESWNEMPMEYKGIDLATQFRLGRKPQ